jgi:hypothetical protein
VNILVGVLLFLVLAKLSHGWEADFCEVMAIVLLVLGVLAAYGDWRKRR